MKKTLPLVFVVILIISAIGFIVPEQYGDFINSIAGGYSMAVKVAINVATVVLAVNTVIRLAKDKKSSVNSSVV